MKKFIMAIFLLTLTACSSTKEVKFSPEQKDLWEKERTKLVHEMEKREMQQKLDNLKDITLMSVNKAKTSECRFLCF